MPADGEGAVATFLSDGSAGVPCREERDASGVRFVWQDDADALDGNLSWRCVTLRTGVK